MAQILIGLEDIKKMLEEKIGKVNNILPINGDNVFQVDIDLDQFEKKGNSMMRFKESTTSSTTHTPQ